MENIQKYLAGPQQKGYTWFPWLEWKKVEFPDQILTRLTGCEEHLHIKTTLTPRTKVPKNLPLTAPAHIHFIKGVNVITKGTVKQGAHYIYRCVQIVMLWKRFYLFIWGFTSLSTLYRSYHDG